MLDPAYRPVPSLELDISACGSTTTVGLAGELDLAAVEQLESAVAAALAEAAETLVIDLSALTFIDSSGVHALLDANRHAHARGVRLLIIPAPDPVNAVFDLCRVDTLLPFVARVPR
jgi:anti-sigma B factor antagonist